VVIFNAELLGHIMFFCTTPDAATSQAEAIMKGVAADIVNG